MRLVEVEVVPYALEFERPYTTARGTLERREMAIVRLLTDAGITGHGEAVPLSLRGRRLAEQEGERPSRWPCTSRD